MGVSGVYKCNYVSASMLVFRVIVLCEVCGVFYLVCGVCNDVCNVSACC